MISYTSETTKPVKKVSTRETTATKLYDRMSNVAYNLYFYSHHQLKMELIGMMKMLRDANPKKELHFKFTDLMCDMNFDKEVETLTEHCEDPIDANDFN